MPKTYSTKEIAASLAGCAPQDMLAFVVREDGTAVVVALNGQKFKYSPEQLAAREQQLVALDTNARAISGDPVAKKPAGRGESATRPLETKSPGAPADSVTKKPEGRGGSATHPLETKKPRVKK